MLQEMSQKVPGKRSAVEIASILMPPVNQSSQNQNIGATIFISFISQLKASHSGHM